MPKSTLPGIALLPERTCALNCARVATVALVLLTVGGRAAAAPTWSSGLTAEEDTCNLSSASPELSAAWDRVEQIDQRKCPQGSELRSLTPEERDEAFACWKEIVWEQVGPISNDPDALSVFLEKRRDERHRRVFARFDSGSIDRDELRELIIDLWDEDWADYLAREFGRPGASGCSKRTLI